MLIVLDQDSNNSRLWQTKVRTPLSECAFASPLTRAEQASLGHQRLGHLHPAGVIKYLKSIWREDITMKDFSLCDSCAVGKTI